MAKYYLSLSMNTTRTMSVKQPTNKLFSVIILTATIGLLPYLCLAQAKLSSFSLQDVTLAPSPFKTAQETDLNYIMSLDPDRLLAPYLREAGLSPKKESYGNWENTGLDGHIGGHYLSALSNMYASTGNKEVSDRLDYMLNELKRCQDQIGSGYLGGTPGGKSMWEDISKGNIKSDTFALNGKWVPLYNIHKLFAGLRDAYIKARKDVGKDILIKLTDYVQTVSSKLTDDQIQVMLFSEHGGLNEVFADVYAITKDEKYLVLAKRFSHKGLLDQLVKNEDKMTGLHANMQIPKAVGFQRIATLAQDDKYGNAAKFFWETVVKNRSVVIGGNSVQEHFNPVNNFALMINGIAGPETCNTYNMLKLTHQLFEQHGHIEYIEFYERALYNHILSSQHPTRGGFVYYTPMKPMHYRVYSQPQTNMWCCVGSGMENHGKYGELIYSHSANDLYVNLLIPSRLSWSEKNIVVTQTTNFPDEGSTRIVVESAVKSEFSIHIRYPSWVEENKMQVFVNGEKQSIKNKPGSFVQLKRRWRKGDVIEVQLPMKLSFERMPDKSNFIAFLSGPIVLAAKVSTNDNDSFLGTENQFGGYRATGKTYSLDESPQLKTNSDELIKHLQRVSNQSQTFTMPDLIDGTKFDNLELIPFYKVHDSRYVIYWPLEER